MPGDSPKHMCPRYLQGGDLIQIATGVVALAPCDSSIFGVVGWALGHGNEMRSIAKSPKIVWTFWGPQLVF